MRQSSEVWGNFETSDYAKKTLGGLKKEAAEKNKLYDVKVPQTGNVGPLENVGWQDGHQSTVATGGGGGGPDGANRDGYNVKSTPIKAAEDGGKVENIAEQHKINEAIATKAPTGKPEGTEGNEALKWPTPKFVNQAALKAAQIKRATVLKELAKLAEKWDAEGNKAEFVKEIDQIIESEVKAAKVELAPKQS